LCFQDTHTLDFHYFKQELMIKRELAKNPKLAEENWDRFLPNFTKRKRAKQAKAAKVTSEQQPSAEPATQDTSQAAAFRAEQAKQKSLQEKKKKKYTPFPPPQMPRKVSSNDEPNLPWTTFFHRTITDLTLACAEHLLLQVDLELESGEYFKKKKARGKSERGAEDSKKAEGRELVSNLKKLNKGLDKPPTEEPRTNPVLAQKINARKRKLDSENAGSADH
jgi:ribosomal RNA assembly protein